VHKKIITGALLVFFVTSMFSSQSAFAGGLCFNDGDCTNNGQDIDGNQCTSVVQCVGETAFTPGACAQPPRTGSCNDGLQCTTGDTCIALLCVGVPNTGNSCSDGLECTTADTCALGLCVGLPNTGNLCGSQIPTTCDGQNRCLVGLCENPNFTVIGASCDNGDGQTCTGACNGIGSCVTAPGTGENCNDSNECTSGDICAAGLCVGLPNVNSCNDSLECTSGDTCIAGSCVGIPLALGSNCGDAGTECTIQDSCDLIGQCVDNGVQNNGDSCGSSSDTECSNADTCFNGECNPNNESGSITCGDTGTACTNQDTCDGSGGCSDNGFASDITSCEADGDQCTGPDTCDGSGVCLVGERIDDIPGCFPVGGSIIPIESTSLILSGAQTFSWMIPVVVSGIGIGLFVVSRKSENS